MAEEKVSAVVCKDVKKYFGEGGARVQALRGVNLDIKQGELIMLMGPSGSGKTTLISVIAGILTQDEGECFVSNLNLNKMPDHEKTLYRGRHIGFVFQIFNLIPSLTSQENIAIPLLLNGVDRKTAIQRAQELLRQVGIPEKAKAYPGQLSGGQQQRVAIARAIVHDPQIIVCDEPTSFLDHETGIKILELLRSVITQDGKTMIVVTHDARILQFADRIAHLEDGLIVD